MKDSLTPVGQKTSWPSSPSHKKSSSLLDLNESNRFIVHNGRRIVKKKKRQCIKCHDCLAHDDLLMPDELYCDHQTDGASVGSTSSSGTTKKPPSSSNTSRRPLGVAFSGGDDYRGHKVTNVIGARVNSKDQRQVQELSAVLSGLLRHSANAVSLPSKIDRLSDEEDLDDDDDDDDDDDEDDEEDNDEDDENDEAEENERRKSAGKDRSYRSGSQNRSTKTTRASSKKNLNNNTIHEDSDSAEALNRKAKANSSSKSTNSNIRRGNKLKRRKAYYSRQRNDVTGRSKSLTSIDALNNPLSEEMDSSEGNQKTATGTTTGGGSSSGDRLTVPRCESAGPGGVNHPGSCFYRRRKLSTAGKVSSSEFLTVSFECFDGEKGPEEFMPATRGTCLREAIATVCDRRGVDVDSINVYLDNSVTPLPLLTTETSWLGGRIIRIRAKDEGKSVIRGGSERISLTAPPSRKASAVSNSGRSKSRLFNPSSSSDDASALLSTSFGGLTYANPQQSASALNISQTSFDNSLLRVASQGSTGGSGGLGGSGGSQRQDSKASKAANRWSGLWGSSAKDSKMAALVQQLDTYSKIGIPKLHHNANFEYEDEVEEALYSLEEDWSDIVKNSRMLNDRLRSQQTAIWELVETEVAYIRTLKVIQDLFLNCLCNLQSCNILTEIDTEKLFCNIPEIFSANRVFWQENLNPMVQRARETGEPLNPDMMLEGFLRFEEIFSPYSRYCSEQTNCQEYCRDQDRNNDIFKAYLAWCETQKDCNRLRLLDILVRPMQRLTKYSLLLKAILKKTDDEQQRNNLIVMDEKVDAFVSDVNSHLRQRQEHERLKTIIARIESYEPVETKDDDLERLVQAHCRLDLTAPMPGCAANHRRQLLFEGDLKLKEGFTSKTDVHAFLFTDMLLLCKNLNKKQGVEGKVKVIRQPFIIDRLVVSDISKEGQNPAGLACVYLNEFQVVASAFTMHSSEYKGIKVWKEQIQKAKELYEEAKAATTKALLENRHSALLFYSPYGDDDESGSVNPIGGSGGPNSSRGAGGGRRGSFRGSRLSSIGHSYSGSVDMTEFMTGSSPPQLLILNQPPNNSVAATPTKTPTEYLGQQQQQQQHQQQQQQRASSISSEEGAGVAGGVENKLRPASASCVSSPGKHTSYPASPRGERRHPLVKTLSPNTLTVQIPFQPVQSLPNLVSPVTSTTVHQTQAGGSPDSGVQAKPDSREGSPKSYLKGRSKSPVGTWRGISYPPVSPKALRRGLALQTSLSLKNPPLIKSKAAVAPATEPATQPALPQNVAIPVITGISPSDEESSSTNNPASPPDGATASDASAATGSANPAAIGPSSDQAKRGGRIERSDNRRYHTAGAIEDIKKETVKDHSIQKRLSWNYGQHIPNNELQLRNKHVSKCLSSDSMRSSSGVSSTGSLHLSIGSELEEHSGTKDNESSSGISLQIKQHQQQHTQKPLIQMRSLGSASTTKVPAGQPPPVPPRNFQAHNQQQQQQQQQSHVSTTYITQDEVVVTNSPKLPGKATPSTSQTPNSTSSAPPLTVPQVQISVPPNNGGSPPDDNSSGGSGKKGDIVKMREMLLSDNSVESSNV